jgi:hypothetical protein
MDALSNDAPAFNAPPNDADFAAPSNGTLAHDVPAFGAPSNDAPSMDALSNDAHTHYNFTLIIFAFKLEISTLQA